MLVRCDYPNEDKKSVIIDTEEDWGRFLEYIWDRCGNDVRDFIMKLMVEKNNRVPVEKYDNLYDEYTDALKTAEEAEDEMNMYQDENSSLRENISEVYDAVNALEKMSTNFVGDFPFHVCFWTAYIKELISEDDLCSYNPTYDVDTYKKCWQKHGDLHIGMHSDYEFMKEQVNW